MGAPLSFAQVLRARGIPVLPDIYTNGGGVTVWGKLNFSLPLRLRMDHALVSESPSAALLKCISPGQVSFFEWVQNLQHFVWEEDEVNRKLEKKMKSSFQSLWGIASSKKARRWTGTRRAGRCHL